MLEPDDIVMGFGPPEGDPDVARVLERRARARRADVCAARRERGLRASPRRSDDPHVHQEMIEILCHTLYETVHVFFEHDEMGHDVGASGFLYPFLGERSASARESLVEEVAASIS